MAKARLIPVVLLRNGVVVQSKLFKRHQILGNPSTIVARLSNWHSDELIYLDISRGAAIPALRTDLAEATDSDVLQELRKVSKKCFMPLTFGGGVRTLEDFRARFRCGADKVAINSQAFQERELITNAAKEFGAQAVVISIDVREPESGKREVFIEGGRQGTGMSPVQWAKEVESRGAGEILLNSIERDGAGQGYDLELISQVANAVRIPVVAMGGVGNWEHLAEGLRAGASAVAAANIFQYVENSVFYAKKHLFDQGHNVRAPAVSSLIPH